MTKRRIERYLALEIIYQQELTENPLERVIHNRLWLERLKFKQALKKIIEILTSIKKRKVEYEESIILLEEGIELLDSCMQNVGMLDSLPGFSLVLITGVKEHQDRIDPMIEDYADNWSLSRMPFLDRNILRIGLFEMLYIEDIPISVSINEAVEMAKKYSTEDSGKFVNGILGKIALQIPGEGRKDRKTAKTKKSKKKAV